MYYKHPRVKKLKTCRPYSVSLWYTVLVLMIRVSWMEFIIVGGL